MNRIQSFALALVTLGSTGGVAAANPHHAVRDLRVEDAATEALQDEALANQASGRTPAVAVAPARVTPRRVASSAYPSSSDPTTITNWWTDRLNDDAVRDLQASAPAVISLHVPSYRAPHAR